MGKQADSTLRQRKSHNDDNDDFLDEVFESSDSSGRKWWLYVIVGLVLMNLGLGYVHLQRRARNKAHEVTIVRTLSDESLPFHIAGHPNGTLVNFHSADCAHCKKLAPEFEAAARELHKIGDTSLVSVNAAQAPAVLKRYEVTRFPTLLWFRRGELIRAVPPSVRTSSTILEFVDQSLQPAVIDFASHEEFDEAVPQLRSVLPGESLPVVVGFGREPGVYSALQQVGEKFRGSTAFLFVKEAHADDPCIRAYFRDAVSDKEYNSSLRSEDVQLWLQPLMEQKAKPKEPKAK